MSLLPLEGNLYTVYKFKMAADRPIGFVNLVNIANEILQQM